MIKSKKHKKDAVLSKKVISILVGVALFAFVVCMALSIYFVVTQNTKDKKADNTNNAQNYYNTKVQQFEEENKTLSDVDIVFVGDSITDFFDTKHFFPQYKTANRGIAGDTTFGVEQRLKISVFDLSPKIVTLLIGINNIDTMFDNYESILQQLKINLPDSKIILLSLTAMTSFWAKNNEKAKTSNQHIKLLAQKYNFDFVDLFSPLCDPNTNELKQEYSLDGGHLTDQGYQVVTNTLAPVFDKYLN